MAMDRSHIAQMRWMAPRGLMERPQMFMKYAPQARVLEVPDPFGGPAQGYERALDLIELGCAGLLAHLAPQVKKAMQG
jgi:protein-tyrosine phosphatase